MPLLGFKRRFAPMVLEGSKRHTIRAIRKIPVKVGDVCHCYVDPRQKSMRLLGRWRCTKVQGIRILADCTPEAPPLIVLFTHEEGADLCLGAEEAERLFWVDGFREEPKDDLPWPHTRQAWEFWKGKEFPFESQMVHWDFDNPVAKAVKAKRKRKA